MTTDREAARARAQAALEAAERVLTAPRAEGLHTPPADPGFDAWQSRNQAERARADVFARAAAAPVAPAAPRNALAAMTDAQIVAFLGSIVGDVRRELMAEQEAMAARIADQEARLAELEGGAGNGTDVP